jgi:predicted DCC family thiol-disulfide oxidoreductase YuxK
MKGPAHAPGRAVLIYDAECALCRNAIAAIESASLRHAFEYLPCGSDGALRRFPRIAPADCRRALHLVLPGGRVLAGADAAPEIIARLPRYRWAVPLIRFPFVRILASLAYKAVARNRLRIGHLLFP